MALPREILRRAARERARSPQRPAVTDIEAHPATPPVAPEPAEPPRAPAPYSTEPAPPLRRVPLGGHANYSALMRRHDRLRTSHLPQASPGGGT